MNWFMQFDREQCKTILDALEFSRDFGDKGDCPEDELIDMIQEQLKPQPKELPFTTR
jgi:hypothetical protein